MFEGTNNITLCKAAVMKIVENYLNQSINNQKVEVKSVEYDLTKGYATFTVISKSNSEGENND